MKSAGNNKYEEYEVSFSPPPPPPQKKKKKKKRDKATHLRNFADEQ